ncbi:creatininase family protein [Pseudoruegeria sp. SK021]|uniref:creatininase family protein n=1 Tax=Pseudoruegeria sp. SK021 TaxID=1933035 RepID=UPI000A22762C|nr:creatininase family protein [Pseudoruegeria sp. SK021]OSP55845.1 creatininase [Pseudoruegeria sp. SK021]
MSHAFWSDLRTTEFSDLPPDTVALVPVGAMEQHGPHLPVSTDLVLAEGMARSAAEATQDAHVLVLPAIAYAKSDEHLSFPGTVTIDAQTLLATLLAVGRGVARAGLRRVVFLNAHGGNVPVLQIACRQLRIELGLFAVSAGWVTMGFPTGLVSVAEARDGVHGGLVETAAMLHFRPELVEMSAARNFVPTSREVAEHNEVLRLLGPVSAGWVAQDLHADGVAGDAAAASAEIGSAIVNHAARRYAQLLAEVARHPIDTLQPLT